MIELKPTILIVEDDEDLRFILESIFQNHNFHTFVAANGLEAYEISLVQNLDAILSDVKMPEMDGVALLKKVRERNKKIPVIFLLTGFADVTESEAMALGANGMLAKPFSGEMVVQTVENAIKKSKLQKAA